MNSSCDALAPNSAPPQPKEHIIPSEARDLHRQIRFPLEIPGFARDEVASGCCRLLQHSLCSTIIHLELTSHSSEDLYDSATAAGAGADRSARGVRPAAAATTAVITYERDARRFSAAAANAAGRWGDAAIRPAADDDAPDDAPADVLSAATAS